jgi:anaerobic selenocysteine-containing dehydrogenase
MSPDDHTHVPRCTIGRTQESGGHDRAVGLPARLHQHLRARGRAAVAERIGRVRGSQRNDYTAGVICEKVARYAERIHHPDRLMKPLRRVGPKGSRQFAEIAWADALDIVAEQFIAKARQHGSETIWPTTTPAPWAWCSATASTGCATR